MNQGEICCGRQLWFVKWITPPAKLPGLGLALLLAMLSRPVKAQVAVFQADFQNSVVQSNTVVTNLDAGTAVGTWSYQMAANVNIYGNSNASQKALCPDSNGNGGYGLTANLTGSVLLDSNATVTLLAAIGRYSSPGTGKSFFLTGYDTLGNTNFDLEVFANQNQTAGTNGSLYWNNGTGYTNWFGTNYSSAGDVRQLSVSSTNYNSNSMTALKIQLEANGYVVSLDKSNTGTFNWVSGLLPYNGAPVGITRISIIGGPGAGDWFDNLMVTGMPGSAGVQLVTNGYVSVQPEDEAQLINGWGFDIKGVSGYVVTPSYAQELFVTDQMNILRVPIWGNSANPAHPAPGQVVGSYYADQIYAMKNARASNPNVRFFASKKSATIAFPAWVTNSSGIIPAEYAVMLADYLQYVQTNGGFTIDVLGIDNEEAAGTTPDSYNTIINDLRSQAAARGITLPQFIAPEAYGPDPSYVSTLLSSGLSSNLDIVGTHYYPEYRPLANLRSLVAAGWPLPDWQSEVHWDNNFGDVIDNGEACLATLFDCTDTGLSSYVWWAYTESGVQGGIEQAFSSSTQQSRPVTTSDINGTASALGTLIARAYRQNTNLVVWVLNNTTNNYNPCLINLNRGSLSGQADYTQWNTNNSITAGAPLNSATNISLDIPSRTITEISVGYVPPGPDAYYELEGNVLDSSGKGNSGTVGAGATNYVPGRIGLQALQFNGSNSYVQIPRSIGAATNFSIAFWMKTTSPGGSGTQWWNGCGLVDGYVGGATADFGVSLLNGNVAFGVGDPDTTLQSSVGVNDGQWHHIAVTRSGFDGAMNLYLDGVMNAARFGPTGPATAPPLLRLGSLQTGAAGNFYTGTLDDVRLYNGLLDTNTIAQLAAAPLPSFAPVLAVVSNQVLIAGQTLNVASSVTDPNVPPLVLTWTLQPVISGLAINPNTGVINWRPTIAQSPSTNALSVMVADNGTPSLSATQQFVVTVLRPVTPQLSSPQAGAGNFGLTITGNQGPDYSVQVSSNLTSWTSLLTTNPSALPLTVQLPLTNHLPQQFYRVQLGP